MRKYHSQVVLGSALTWKETRLDNCILLMYFYNMAVTKCYVLMSSNVLNEPPRDTTRISVLTDNKMILYHIVFYRVMLCRIVPYHIINVCTAYSGHQLLNWNPVSIAGCQWQYFSQKNLL